MTSRGHIQFAHVIVVAFLVVGVHFGGKACAQSDIPRLISKTQLEKYLEYLQLSEAQLVEVARLHKAYAELWSENFDRDIGAFNAKWSAPYTNPHGFQGDSMASAFHDALEVADRLKYKLRNANDAYFDQIEGIMTDDQAIMMQRVRLAHDRYTYRRSHGNGLRERHIDPIELAEQLPLDGADRQRVSAVIMDFEPVYVEALRAAADAGQRRSLIEFQVLDVVRQTEENVEPALALKQEKGRLLEQAGKVAYRPERRLIDTTRRVIEQMKAVLSSGAAAELQRQFNQRGYPEVYPDPVIADPFFDSVENLEGLDEERLAVIRVLRQQYLDEHARLSTAMTKSLFDLSVIGFRAAADYPEKRTTESDRYRELSENRERLNLAQPTKARAMLLPEESERVPLWRYEKEKPPSRWDPRKAADRPDRTPKRSTTRPTSQPK